MFILDCSSDLKSCCNDYALANVLGIVKEIIHVIQIAVPIVLLVMMVVQLFVLMHNPDDKKNVKKIYNKLIAVLVVFFVPIVVDAVMLLLTNSFNAASCWTNAAELKEELSKNRTIFISDTSRVPQVIIDDASKYEPGEERTIGSNNFNDFEHLNYYNQSGSFAQYTVCENGAKGGKSVAATACGLSSYMAARYVITGKDTDFMDFCHEACRTGMFNGNGTSWEFSEVANSIYPSKYGIKTETMEKSYQAAVEELKKGNVVIPLIRYGTPSIQYGGFNGSSGMHFIVLVKYDSSKDQIYVYNPTGVNTGWTSRDRIEKYVIGCAVFLKRASRS